MKNLFEELEDRLKAITSPVLPLLNESINETQLSKELAVINFKLPTNGFELYSWRNGTSFNSKLINMAQTLFFNGRFPSIERSIEVYKYYSEHDRDFKKSYFSLFETVGGVMYLLDCDEKSNQYGMLLKHDISLSVSAKVVTSVYDSIDQFLRTIIECYQEGIYFIDDIEFNGEAHKVLNSDYPREIEVSRKLNPRSAYWKLLE